MPTTIQTGRGRYAIEIAGPIERGDDGAVVVTLSLKRSDGIETVSFRCRIAGGMLKPAASADEIIETLAPWIEHQFEMTRELALKTIRSERKLLEIFFDALNRGPF